MPRRKEPHIPDAILDQLLAGADPKTALDPNGLLDGLKKALAERALNAEMTVSEMSCVGSGGCSCSGHGSCEALAEEDGELSLGHTPLTGRHGPLFLRLVQDQE